MNTHDYQQQALYQIGRADRQTKDEQLLNGALGATGEAGEIADIIKKHHFHGHALDTQKLLLELGDLLWYTTLLASAIGATLDDVMVANIEKLRRRYPNGFNNADSQQRAE